MATISTIKRVDNEAPLHLSITFERHIIEADLSPSTLIQVDDETMSAADVLGVLDEEFNLSTFEGMWAFLYDQNWFEQEAGKWHISLEISDNNQEEK